MRITTMLAIVAVSQPAFTQVANLQVVKATYETRSRASADEPWNTVETGTHYITADGRYRVDKERDGVGTFEITDSAGAKYLGDTTTREVKLIRPMSGRARAQAEQYMSDVELQSTDGPIAIGQNMEYLGQRQVGGLTLEGIRATVSDYPLSGEAPLMETWLYFPSPLVYGARPVPPITMEERQAGGLGPQVEKSLTEVTAEFVSPSIFAVPEGYVVGNP